MKKSSIVLLIFTMALLASCQHSSGPKLEPSYSLVPDTLRGSIGQTYTLTMQSSDTAWRAYKYLWDLGDGRTPYFVRASDSTTFSYSATGVYHVTAIAMDSLDNVIAKSNALAVIGIPSAKVTITPHNPSITSFAPVLFSVSINPSLPVYYVWNFGDGAPAVSAYYDTISHLFTTNGTFRATVTAIYEGYAVGSDTSLITVTLPTTTLAALSSMTSVTATFMGCDTESITLPLINSGDYSVTVIPAGCENDPALQAAYHHQVSIPIMGGVNDTLDTRAIGISLPQGGRYLNLCSAAYFDSTHSQYDSLQIFRSSAYHFTEDSLVLISVSADSIVFATPLDFFATLYQTVLLNSTVVPATGGNGGCPGGGIGINIGPAAGTVWKCSGRATITFKR